jgi:hypothetical protein
MTFLARRVATLSLVALASLTSACGDDDDSSNSQRTCYASVTPAVVAYSIEGDTLILTDGAGASLDRTTPGRVDGLSSGGCTNCGPPPARLTRLDGPPPGGLPIFGRWLVGEERRGEMRFRGVMQVEDGRISAVSQCEVDGVAASAVATSDATIDADSFEIHGADSTLRPFATGAFSGDDEGAPGLEVRSFLGGSLGVSP